MKKTVVLVLALGLTVPFAVFSKESAKTIPLAEARARIGEVISQPNKMKAVMKRLSAEDQVAFLADVNAAIANMPGSAEERAAVFLNVNSVALRSGAKGNTANLLAEVYATVSPEALPLLTERFSADLFNRAASSSRAYSDDSFSQIASQMLDKIVKRTSGSDDADVRNAFAALLFIRSSNGLPKDLPDVLLRKIPDENVRDLAKTEWFPAAMSEKPNYDSIVAYAGAEKPVDVFVAIRISGVQAMDAMLSDLAEDVLDPTGRTATPLLDRAFGHFGEARVTEYPDPQSLKEFGDEPKPYQWQKN